MQMKKTYDHDIAHALKADMAFCRRGARTGFSWRAQDFGQKRKARKPRKGFESGDAGSRTPDLRLMSPLLYQLSYIAVCCRVLYISGGAMSIRNIPLDVNDNAF